MVNVLVGDIFESRCQTLVNTVNCVGVMGKGLALQFKKQFPEMYQDYVTRCERKEVRLGEPYLFRRLLPPWILNFPTKDHWRSVAKLDDIVRGLAFLEQHYQSWGMESIAVPPLGCGEGQLEWRVVGPTLFRHLSTLEIKVELYAPFGTSHEELQAEFLRTHPAQTHRPSSPSRIRPGWVAVVEILRSIEREPYHHPIGRISFQKLVYFATAAGIPTGLEFTRGSYGPFAPDLKTILTRLVNNGLIVERKLGRMLAVGVGPTFEDARREFCDQLDRWKAAIERVVDLMMRFDTQQAEVAATAHFAARIAREAEKRRPSEKEVLEEALAWKARRKPALQPKELAAAIRGLGMLGWLDAEVSDEIPVEEEALLGA